MRKNNIIVAALVAGCYIFTACSSSQPTTSGNTGTSSTQETSTNASGNTSSSGMGSGSTTGTGTGSPDHAGHSTGSGSTMGTASGSGTDGAAGNTGNASTSGMGSSARSGMSGVNQKLHQSMQSMMDKMMQMQMTGDVDHDFAHMMAEHHQGAIDMSRIVLQSGDDEQIKSLAQKIVDKQQQEKEELKAFGKQTAASGDKTNSQKLMDSMHNSMSSMQHSEMTGDADHDYAHMMVQHHKDAIAMAKVETQYGKDAKLKTMAQKIIDDSQKEIDQLQTWIKTDSK